MKYILMMNCPKTGYDTFGAMAAEGHTGAYRIHDGLQQVAE